MAWALLCSILWPFLHQPMGEIWLALHAKIAFEDLDVPFATGSERSAANGGIMTGVGVLLHDTRNLMAQLQVSTSPWLIVRRLYCVRPL